MTKKFHNKKCFMSHMGKWLMDEMHFNQLRSVILSEKVVIQAQDGEDDEKDMTLLLLTNGILVMNVEGTIMKAESSFGGTSSVRMRQNLREAAANPQVRGIMLNISSPGGHVDGTDELALEIARTAEIKPVHAFANGLMASAAFWIGSQAAVISASRTSEVGSLGTVAVVHDFSGAFEAEGIKTHVISTGKFKGAFVQGAEITEEMLEDLQASVDALNEFFMEAVESGRGMPRSQVKSLFDGRVHLAADALKLGLIDKVQSFEGAIADLTAVLPDSVSDEAVAMERVRANRR